MSFKIYYMDSPKITEKMTVYIQGRIIQNLPKEYGNQIIIDNVKIENINSYDTPKKILLSVRTKIEANIGDIIDLRAMIYPYSPKLIYDSYDFARDLYFKQIGAMAFALGKAKIYKKNSGNNIENFRRKLGKFLIKNMGEETGYIASALIIGEYSGIDKNILNNIRVSGLAHILAVSGMHMSLVAWLCFNFARFILVIFFPNISTYIDNKQIAAVFSFIGTIIYLLISGGKVAALRAFIMNMVIIYGVFRSKNAISIRNLWFAGFVILFFEPQMLVTPSFQMSFAAVIVLISLYEKFIKFFSNNQDNYLKKFRNYFIGIIISSLLASFATMPFAIYHFNQMNNYGVISNLIMLPIISFVIMPLIVLLFIFYLINCGDIITYLLTFPLKLMVKIAAFVNEFPYSNIIIPHMPSYSLGIITFGILIICIMKNDKKIFGLSFIIIGIILMKLHVFPNIIIIEDKNIIYFDEDNKKLILFGRNLKGIKKENIAHYYGFKEFSKIIKFNSYKDFSKIIPEINVEVKNNKISNIKFNVGKENIIYPNKKYNYSIWLNDQKIEIKKIH